MSQLQSSLGDRYRVVREIGAGGMATVYLARDIRHDRQVALKLLRPELGAVLGVERFLSEIRVTANLQHPHLLPLFDSGEAGGLLYYVMPFVEGESLRDRLERERQLAVDEALRITVAVASALDYAHRHHVVHRDLKPENILLHDGQPLVSDFGIALAVSNAGGARITQTGFSLGTPQYMSPEQATGDRAVDARSDIYSLACVTYEMLVGEAPHTGPTVQAIIARVLVEKPRGVRVSRPSVPEHVEAALDKALAKLPADRFASAQQFADALMHPERMPAAMPVPAPAPTARRPRSVASLVPWIVAAAATIVAVVAITRRPNTRLPVAAQFTVDFPTGVSVLEGAGANVVVSPDGRAVYFTGAEGRSRVYVRTLGDANVSEVEALVGGTGPFLSPDARSIGFFSEGRIRTMSLAGGGITTAASIPAFAGASWGPNDVIVYSGAGLWRVPSVGGKPTQLTAPNRERGDGIHVQPQFLPDGESFLFVIFRTPSDARLAIGWLDGSIRELGIQGFRPQYVETGHLLYSTAEGNIMAAPFDVKNHRVTGPAAVVVEDVRTLPNGTAVWGASPNGTIAFDAGESTSRLVLVDRAGQVQRLSDDAKRLRLPRFSPNGNRIAVEMLSGEADAASDIFIFNRLTASLTRFTSRGGASDPLWTPDGRRLCFTLTVPLGDRDIYCQDADGSGAPQPLVRGPGNQYAWSWSPDGRTLIFDDIVLGKPTRIMAFTMGDSSPPRAVVESQYANRVPKLSPDGRWLAYVSDESGRMEIYVRPFPGAGGKQQISTTGGTQPMWSRNGRELFYRTVGKFVSASLRLDSEVVVTGRAELFNDTFVQSNSTNYDVAPDGSGFLMLLPVQSRRQLTVMVNWLDHVRNRLASTGAKP